MSEESIKDRILKAISDIPESAFSEKIKPLEDPDIKKLIEDKIAKGVSISRIHASISPDIVEISDTYFRKWLVDSRLIKKRNSKMRVSNKGKES